MKQGLDLLQGLSEMEEKDPFDPSMILLATSLLLRRYEKSSFYPKKQAAVAQGEKLPNKWYLSHSQQLILDRMKKFFFDTANIEYIKEAWSKLESSVDKNKVVGITTNPNAFFKLNKCPEITKINRS
jgi:hypothetical protein